MSLARVYDEPAKRRPMTPARKARLWGLRGGLCGECGEPTELAGPLVQYDHRIPLELLGPDEDENIWPMHARPCHAAKTKREAPLIAKARRLRKRELGERRSRVEIRSPGFDRTRTRGFDGKVRARRLKSPPATE